MQDASNREKPFRYEANWAPREECLLLVKEEWKKPMLANNKMNIATEGLQRCKAKLIHWSKVNFGNSKRIISTKHSQISKLQESNHGERGNNIKALQKEVDLLLEKEDIKRKQKPKQRWLKEGDKITQFFHQYANQRRKTNTTKNISDDCGNMATNP